jgi:hypothetical protein
MGQRQTPQTHSIAHCIYCPAHSDAIGEAIVGGAPAPARAQPPGLRPSRRQVRSRACPDLRDLDQHALPVRFRLHLVRL